MRRLLLFIVALGTVQAATVSIEIASPGNIYSNPQFASDRGYYVGPYTLVVNGETMLGLCVDFYHQSTLGHTWGAFETPVTAAGMNNTYGYQENARNPNVNAVTLQTYEEEVYLYRQIIAAFLPNDRIAIQEAAWSITDPGFSISNNLEAQLWAAAAENPANYQHVNLSGVVIYSDVKGINGGDQEFISIPVVNAAPEPAAIGLLAGLLGLACVKCGRRVGLDVHVRAGRPRPAILRFATVTNPRKETKIE
jgi:hypothetical protein